MQLLMKAIVAIPGAASKATPQLKEIPYPTPKKGEVLIKVKATTVGPSCLEVFDKDYKKLPRNIRKKDTVSSGIEFSGEVVSEGKRFHCGEAVAGAIDYMSGRRAMAEYAVIPEDWLINKPPQLSHDETASMIIGSLTAYEALVKLAAIKANQRVLIYGANGAIGVQAVRIAKHYGGIVTTTSRETHYKGLISIGADKALSPESFFNSDHSFDIIFDVSGALKFNFAKQYLTKKGEFVTTQPLNDICGFVSSLFSTKKSKFLYVGNSSGERPKIWQRLVEDNVIKPVISKVYSIQDYTLALDDYRQESQFGKIIINVE